MPKLEEITAMLERYVGPNGAYVLMVDNTSNVEFRTKGRETTIIGLNQLGSQYVEQLIYAKIQKNLTGKDADLVRE